MNRAETGQQLFSLNEKQVDRIPESTLSYSMMRSNEIKNPESLKTDVGSTKKDGKQSKTFPSISSILNNLPRVNGLVKNDQNSYLRPENPTAQTQINLQRDDSERFVGREIKPHNGGNQTSTDLAKRRMAIQF